MRVLIVDDESPARARLKQIIEDLEGYEFAAEAGNGELAISLASETQADIVLLDIRMPGINGIETARHLNTLENPPAIVFTTAYDQYAVEAFEARAIGYVLKPVRRNRLEAALEHASRLAGPKLRELADSSGISASRQHICARVHDRLTLIPVENIDFFQADQKYVAIHHDGGKSLIDESLKALESEFADRFVRIHRAVLVAVAKIDVLEKTGDGKTRVVLRGGSQHNDGQLIISRRHVAEVRRRLKGG